MTSAAPNEELPRRAVIATMAGIGTAMLMASLDGTIVGTAMPRVIADLHGFEHYAWVVTAYMVATTAVVPIVGKLSDLFGRKPFLLAGVAIFVAGSALCGSAQSMTQLIVFRALQGIGAGFTQAMAFTTIADLFPPSRRGRVSGVMGAVFGISSVIGPALGGFLTDGPGWRWCFYVNLPVGVVAFGVLLLAFPRLSPQHEKRPRIDVAGTAALLLSVIPLLLAVSWGGRDYPWASPVVLGLFGFGAVMAATFFALERRAESPIIPLQLFRDRIVWSSAAAATLVSMAMVGLGLFVPLFIQGVIGSSATRSGAVLTPMMLAMIGASMASGQVITRTGRYHWLAVTGVGLTGAGMVLMSRMGLDTSYATVVRNMIVTGVGLGMTMPVFSLAVQNAVDLRHVGVATSSIQFLRSMGGAAGAAVFGAVLSNRFAPAFASALSPELAQRVPPQLLARFENPQLLMTGGADLSQRALAALGAGGQQTLAALMGAMRAALSGALQDVFIAGALLVAVGATFTLLLRDVPLRTTNHRTASAPAPEAPPAPEETGKSAA